MNSEQHAHEVLEKILLATQTKLVADLLNDTEIETRFEILTHLDALAHIKKQMIIEMDKCYDPE